MPEDSREEVLEAFEFALEAQLQAVRRLRRRRTPSKASSAKGMSQVGMSFEILRDAGEPMHADALIVAMGQRYGVQPARDSLVSALTKKVMAGERFEKSAPNTFTLRRDALG